VLNHCIAGGAGLRGEDVLNANCASVFREGRLDPDVWPLGELHVRPLNLFAVEAFLQVQVETDQGEYNGDWPAGFVSGVVQTPDNLWVVPEISPGRVQVYDSNWHFLRGWQVKSFGKKFRIACNTLAAEQHFGQGARQA